MNIPRATLPIAAIIGGVVAFAAPAGAFAAPPRFVNAKAGVSAQPITAKQFMIPTQQAVFIPEQQSFLVSRMPVALAGNASGLHLPPALSESALD